MIAKIGKGENLRGALSYNQLKVDKEKGQILLTHKIPETLDGNYTVAHFYHSFEPYLIANIKTEKPVLHISLNPDPSDKVSDTQFKSMAQEYMEQMGYGNQPYVMFKHTDIDRTHIHIVSTSVGIDGKKISDKFDHPRSMEICRALEKKYHLTVATQHNESHDKKIFKSVDYKKGDVKSQIAAVVRHLPRLYRFQTLGSYNALLSLFNLTAEEVKGELSGQPKSGLVYFALNEKGEKTTNPFKSSLFGKQAGLVMLGEHFEKSKGALKSEPAKSVIKNTVEVALHTAADENSFKQQLLEQGINTVVRKSNEGRIYGMTFIDHTSKSVWNGSQLGKDLSANIFNDWWNNGQKPVQLPIEETPNAKKEIAANTSRNLREDPFELSKEPGLYTNEENHFFEALGGLLPDAKGEDYEETAFANRMKKRRKGRNKK